MIGLNFGWQCHRLAVDRVGYVRPFSGRTGFKKVLFLSERDDVSRAQVFSFFLHAHDLEDQHQIEVRELPLPRFLNGFDSGDIEPDAVLIQTWFDLAPTQLQGLTARIKQAWPEARIAYLDWFAPADLRYADALHSVVAAYVKKQIYKDFSQYGQSTLGDTNLTDFYARRFGIALPDKRFPVPSDFQHKLVLGPGFEDSPHVLQNLASPLRFEERTIDLHARFSTHGTEWYARMRNEAQNNVVAMEGRHHIVCRNGVPRRQYFTELLNSKLCFSPFGYGEICWRDFEAMSTGALLLKPDVSHLRLANDFFAPFETYVPLAWDLSDLREKVDYYVDHAAEREIIARNAFERLWEHHQQKKFLRDMEPLWQRLRVN